MTISHSFAQKYTPFGIIFLFFGAMLLAVSHPIEASSLPTSVTLYVGGDGPGNYTSIQDAIDNASDGDTVFVYSGTYLGYVVIDKAISLIGEEKNTTVINGYFAYTVSVEADGAAMSGFTVLNGAGRGEGFRIDSSYNNVTGNIIDLPRDRIRLAGDSNTFQGNIVRNCYLFLSGDGNTIAGNTIMNSYYGIYLIDSSDNVIVGNSLVGSGLFIADEAVWNNVVWNNTVNGKPLVYLDGASDLVIGVDAGQILLVNCTNIVVRDQQLLNTTVGVQLWGSGSCVITGSVFTGDRFGVSVHGWDNVVGNNTVAENFYGIYLTGDSNNVSHNTLSGNNNGVYLEEGEGNRIGHNIFLDNYDGVLLDYGSFSSDLFNNTFTGNKYGVFLSGDRNVVSDNSFTGNDEGLYVTFSDSNDISQNTVIGNINGLVFMGDRNTIGGNLIGNNTRGVILSAGEHNSITNNTIVGNEEGVVLACDENLIVGNLFCNNTDGLRVSDAMGNIVAGNTIVWSTGSGILVNGSDNNTISGDSLLHNGIGVYLVSSSNNTVMNNTFRRNGRHALFEDCTNQWSGNYWGRPRVLPKLIFGVSSGRGLLPFLDVDWHPAFFPY